MPLLSSDLREFCAPFKKMGGQHALSATYRALTLAPDGIRGLSPHARLEIRCKPGLEETVHVDASTFLAVLDSLPGDQELILAPDAGVLMWQCGPAKGKLALIALEEDPPRIEQRPSRKAAKCAAGLAAALELGSLSSGAQSLASIGFYGVVLEPGGGGLRVMSTDNDTISCVYLEGSGLPGQGAVTISPEAATILGTLITDKGKLEVGENWILYEDEGSRALINRVAQLASDIGAVLSRFASPKAVAPIPRERIAAFIKRATALAEARRGLVVTLHAEDGQLALSFEGNSAMSDEYYLTEGLKLPSELSVKVHADRLVRALAHVDRVALDHADQGTLVFLGGDPDFQYLVAGSV